MDEAHPVFSATHISHYREMTWNGHPKTMWGYDYYLLDREFWQYLAKAEGWETSRGSAQNTGSPDSESAALYYWHRFLQHVSTGKDAESFLSAILNPAESQPEN